MKAGRIILFGLAAAFAVLIVLKLNRPPSVPGPGVESPFAEALARTTAALKEGRGAAGNQALLSGLRAQLDALSPEAAVAALRAALLSGLDAPTGLDLKPGSDGRLAGASSLRVFLLDELRARDPEAAHELAKKILAQFTTPDEWALSLAVCATDSSPAGVEFLRGKARALVQHEPWQREPTTGFLEAFDVFVFTHDTAFTPELAGFLNQTNNRALAHAAFLTLDRLAIQDTPATLGVLVDRPDLLSGREATRAGYLARADVRDATQRAVLERYLLNPALTARELDQFAGTFPSANFMVSQNLLTRSATPDGATIAARDAATLPVLDQWLADPRFAHLQSALTAVRARLQKFVSTPK